MAPRKGTTNNPNSRPKGVPNKTTAELRKIIKDYTVREFEQLPVLVENICAKDRVN